MSIVGASAQGLPVWAWVVWLLLAAAVAAVGLLREKPNPASTAVLPVQPEPVADTEATAPRPLDYQAASANEDIKVVPLLAVTGILSFIAWVATQMVYIAVRVPLSKAATVPAATGPAVWSAADLATLSLASAIVGWSVALGLIAYAGGVRAIGYGVRRVPSGLLAGAIGVFVALPVIYFCLEATLFALNFVKIDHPAKHELLEVMAREPQQWVRVVALLSAAVSAPLFEEILFRGCVQGGLSRSTGRPWVGIVVASVLFASIHPFWTIPPIFVFSLLLGLVYDRTKNLWACTIMHALFNLFSIFNSGMN